MSALVVQGDAAHLPLPDDSVDLVVTSPPYFGLRSYQDQGKHYEGQIGAEAMPREFVAALLDCTREWTRVLKPTGSIWVNLGDKYSQYEGARKGHGRSLGKPNREMTGQPLAMPVSAPSQWGIKPKSLMGLPWRYALGCIDELGLILREEVVWSKPNGMPESVTDRCRRVHEQWFHFTTQSRYYSAIDEIREPYEAKPQRRFSPRRNDEGRPEGRRMVEDYIWSEPTAGTNPLGKLPGSVWSVPTEPFTGVPESLGIKHFAAFPSEFPKRIIQGWSPSGYCTVVLDPFGGTGTTALVADLLGRTGITVDMSHDYSRLATWRTTDEKQRARVTKKIRVAR